MSQTPPPLLARLSSIIAWLTEQIREPEEDIDLPTGCRDRLLARLRRLEAELSALAEAPGLPNHVPEPPAPWFVPSHTPYRIVFADLDDPPSRVGRRGRIPPSWRWLAGLAPRLRPGRVQLEAILREPECQALLRADPRFRRLLRPLVWVLGADPRLLPRERANPKIILVPGADVSRARVEYAAVRQALAPGDAIRRCCAAPNGPAARLVWLGPAACPVALIPRRAPRAPATLSPAP
ncbi:MAG: hypothetical protein ACP5NP_04000 [Acetobacteraceae bacterium]